MRPRLVRHQRHAEHAPGFFLHVLDGLHHLDAAALAAPAGMDLRLHHPDRPPSSLAAATASSTGRPACRAARGCRSRGEPPWPGIRGCSWRDLALENGGMGGTIAGGPLRARRGQSARDAAFDAGELETGRLRPERHRRRSRRESSGHIGGADRQRRDGESRQHVDDVMPALDRRRDQDDQMTPSAIQRATGIVRAYHTTSSASTAW